MVSLLDNIARPSAIILQLSVVLGVIFVLLKVVRFYQGRKKILKALEAFPGPPAHWLYGHNHLVRTELGSAGVGLSQHLLSLFPRRRQLACGFHRKINLASALPAHPYFSA